MNCFYHPSVVAVGCCKSCMKGLCLECGHDLEKGLACRGRCEEDVQAIQRMLNHSSAMLDARKGNFRGGSITNGIFYIAMGLIFIVPALVVHDAVTLILALPFGLLVAGLGLSIIRRARKLPK